MTIRPPSGARVSSATRSRRASTPTNTFTKRACLIGENGTGKSTLLRIIAGLDNDHGGTVTAPGLEGLFYQQPPFGIDRTVAKVLGEATAPVRDVAWDVERQVSRLVDGLDLTRILRERPARELSGGQLFQLSLAWLLLRRPDTLLLDEPTSHDRWLGRVVALRRR